MRQLEQDEIRARLTGMLDALHEYCRLHGLQMLLVGGTLLGAVRHKGFIPWDDDIDVAMPRPDYERLRRLVRKEPPAGEFSFSFGDDGSYSNPYGQMMDLGTTLSRKSLDFLRRECVTEHLYMDIFPVDGYPDTEEETRRYLRRLGAIRKAILYSRSRLGRGSSTLRSLVKFFPVLLARAIGNRRLVRHMIGLCKSRPYEGSTYIGTAVNGLYGPGERYLKSEALPPKKVTFEGKEYPTLGCYEGYLRGIYGEYEKLPPKEKRITHEIQVFVE